MQVAMVAGLGWGDESKGSTVDWLVRQMNAKTVVRYNGGPQAGHTVELPDGTRHVFAQFGAGTFAGANTYLSKYMLVNPINMYYEAAALAKAGVHEPLDLISVSPDSLVITPFHIMANRLRESSRGEFRHGSCGMGIGETIQYSISFPETTLRVSDLTVKSLATEKITAIREHFVREFGLENDTTQHVLELDALARIIDDYCQWAAEIDIVPDEDMINSALYEGNLVFEGAQGVLLDETHGFKPHNTWTNTTFANANALLSVCEDKHDVSRIGILRCYSTRHGAGPLITESNELANVPVDKTNVANEWQGSFRRGYFDVRLAKYAINAIGKVDSLMLSCMDHIAYMPKYQVATDYSISGKITDSLLKWAKPVLKEILPEQVIAYLTTELQTPIRLASYGPTCKDKKVI